MIFHNFFVILTLFPSTDRSHGIKCVGKIKPIMEALFPLLLSKRILKTITFCLAQFFQ